MISALLSKQHGTIVETKILVSLKSHEKEPNGRPKFGDIIQLWTTSVMLMTIVEQCCNNKIKLLCCFVDFRKTFDTMPRTNLWNSLEELKVLFELRDVVRRLYKNIIVKCMNTESWLEDINCNLEVQEACPMSPTFLAYTLTS